MSENKYTPKRIDKFWSRVKIGNPDECWEWQASCFPTGYGHLTIKGKSLYSHRVSWELTNGEIPDGLFVCHKCDNPPCCNPQHLFVGTPLDNVRDRDAKGRGRKQPKKFREEKPRQPRIMPTGESSYHHKLTWELVATIRQRYSMGDVTQTQLAKEYNVAISTISRLVHGFNWNGLDE